MIISKERGGGLLVWTFLWEGPKGSWTGEGVEECPNTFGGFKVLYVMASIMQLNKLCLLK